MAVVAQGDDGQVFVLKPCCLYTIVSFTGNPFFLSFVFSVFGFSTHPPFLYIKL